MIRVVCTIFNSSSKSKIPKYKNTIFWFYINNFTKLQYFNAVSIKLQNIPAKSKKNLSPKIKINFK